MNSDNFLSLIIAKKQTIIMAIIIFILIAIIFTAIQPFKYGSSFKLLIIHNFRTNTDPYIASKSNEYLSGILAKVIYSNSFFTKVAGTGFNIDEDYFGKDTKERIERWEKTVVAKAISDTGIISVDVYHPDRYQAEQIARAIVFSLQASHSLYHGYGDNVTIKVIDKPITSDWPIKPNIILNLVTAIAFGLILSLIYIYLFPETEYNLRLWPQKNQKPKIPGQLCASGAGKNQKNMNENFYIKDNWESVGDVLDKDDYPLSWQGLEEGNREDNRDIFRQSNLDIE